MSNQNDNQPVVWAVLVAVIILAVGLALGFGIAKSKKPATAPAAVTAPASAAWESADRVVYFPIVLSAGLPAGLKGVAHQALEGLPGNVPAVTGATRARVLGAPPRRGACRTSTPSRRTTSSSPRGSWRRKIDCFRWN